jgi:erythrin-vacuolar iron transport family protein
MILACCDRTNRWDEPMKTFSQPTPRELSAVAISSEEDDARIHLTFADDLNDRYAASAKIFEETDRTKRNIVASCLSHTKKDLGPYLPPTRTLRCSCAAA